MQLPSLKQPSCQDEGSSESGHSSQNACIAMHFERRATLAQLDVELKLDVVVVFSACRLSWCSSAGPHVKIQGICVTVNERRRPGPQGTVESDGQGHEHTARSKRRQTRISNLNQTQRDTFDPNHYMANTHTTYWYSHGTLAHFTYLCCVQSDHGWFRPSIHPCASLVCGQPLHSAFSVSLPAGQRQSAVPHARM